MARKAPVKPARLSKEQAARKAFAESLKRFEGAPKAKASPQRQAKPFAIPQPPPGVLPSSEARKPSGALALAMDEAPGVVGWSNWASQYGGSWAFTEGLEFLGYPYLSELSQRPEYRKVVEIPAIEATRKWIKFTAKGGNKSKESKIADIEAEMVRLKVRDHYKTIIEQDGFFGRAHLYHDLGVDLDDINNPELLTSIGNGRDEATKAKVNKKTPLLALKPVEALWTYPTNYNSTQPLKQNWYRPDLWYVMGTRVNSSRLPCFISRPVPDLLKPAYSFGGLALTQLVKPYVDNWLVTRQGVQDIINSYTVFALATAMSEQMQVGGEVLTNRANVFTNYRNNRGLMLYDKDLEDFKNVSAPLAGLEALQAQALEHICVVANEPLVKFTGNTPSGLNASSEGEIRVWYDWINAFQNSFIRSQLQFTIDLIQMSIFGKVDEDITFEFVPLFELDEKAAAEVDKIKADTAQVRIDSGVIDPTEEREHVVNDAASPYPGLDPEDAPDLLSEEMQGLEIPGARPEVAVQELEGGKPNGKGKAKPKAAQ